jgi:hypothetical protein
MSHIYTCSLRDWVHKVYPNPEDNTILLVMFLHVLRIDLVIFYLCFAISIVVKNVYSIFFSVIFKHEI